jgi:predicted Zn-dependent protease
VLEQQGDWPGALDHYEHVYTLSPRYGMGDVFREVGKAYLHTGKVEKAIEFLHFFLKERHSDPEGRYWLAVAQGKQGNLRESKAELSILLEQARSGPRFFRKENRRWIFLARGLSSGSRAGS